MTAQELCAVLAERRTSRNSGGYLFYPPIPKLICADGFQLSVQASQYHYCAPREDAQPFYCLVEVGYPSEKEPLLMQYAEEADNPTETVYGYVPTELVAEIVTKHGGLKND